MGKFDNKLLLSDYDNTFCYTEKALSGSGEAAPVNPRNLEAVRYWMEAEKIAPENLLVVSDDIALPFGTLRLRPKGSAGGHNGLKNIAELLGTENFARMRFGVGGDFPKGHQVDYVLGEWSEEDRKAMPERLKVFCDAILSFATIGVERTMNFFNKK